MRRFRQLTVEGNTALVALPLLGGERAVRIGTLCIRVLRSRLSGEDQVAKHDLSPASAGM
jgi:hypothetical protein